ncbi:MAG: outer membrane protein assembly factor BamB [Succinivibrionaceae bacterium]
MFRKSFLFAGIIGLSVFCQSCSLFEKDVYKPAEVPEIENSFEATVIWHTSVGDGIEKYFNSLAPAVTEERVFVAARDGTVKALNRRDGSTVWKIDLDDEEENEDRRSPRISAGVSAGFDKIFVASENGYVYALDRSNGKLIWKKYVGHEVLSAPHPLADRVLVYTVAGNMLALSDFDGSVLWKTSEDPAEITLRGTSPITDVDGGKVAMYGTSHGKINMVDTSNGMLINSLIVTLPKGTSAIDRLADVDAQPVFAHGAIYAVGYHGQLVSMLGGGHRGSSWKKNISSYSSLAFDYSDVFVTDDKGHVHALSQTSGTEHWENNDLSYRGVTAPAVLNGYVLVGDMDGYLYWLDGATGRIVSMDRMDSDGLYIPPVIYDGVAYLQTRNGEVFALTNGPAPAYTANEEEEKTSSESFSDDEIDTSSSWSKPSASDTEEKSGEEAQSEKKSWSKWFRRQ